MKCFFFVLSALAFAMPVYAQIPAAQQERVTIDLTKSKTFGEIVTELSGDGANSRIGIVAHTAGCEASRIVPPLVPYDDFPVYEVLKQVAGRIGCYVEVKPPLTYIRKVKPGSLQEATVPEVTATQNANPVVSGPAVQARSAAIQPPQMDPDEMYRRRRSLPGYNPCFYGDYGCESFLAKQNRFAYGSIGYPAAVGYGAVGYMQPGTVGYVDPFYAEVSRTVRNRGTIGGLKTQGRTKGVEIYLRGCYIGAANQIDGIVDQKVPLIAGEYADLTAVRISDGHYYTWPVRAYSQAENEVVGGRHMTIVITDDHFKEQRVFDQSTVKKDCEASSR